MPLPCFPGTAAGTVCVLADTSSAGRSAAAQASTSATARQEAVRGIPIQKLDAASRAKVNSVLANVTAFRRLPMRVIDCDPQLHLFCVRHPDVLVNIWDVLKLSQLQVRQIGPDKYRVVEKDGTTAVFEYVYRSHDTHIVYVEGTYAGNALIRQVKGRGLMVLKTGYVRETDGRYYATNRLDAFISVEPGMAELLTRTIHPMVGGVVDNNFTQTVAFVGNLSRTAEVNGRGVQRLAEKLAYVQPDVRKQFAELAGGVAARSWRRPAAQRRNAAGRRARRGGSETLARPFAIPGGDSVGAAVALPPLLSRRFPGWQCNCHPNDAGAALQLRRIDAVLLGAVAEAAEGLAVDRVADAMHRAVAEDVMHAGGVGAAEPEMRASRQAAAVAHVAVVRRTDRCRCRSRRTGLVVGRIRAGVVGVGIDVLLPDEDQRTGTADQLLGRDRAPLETDAVAVAHVGPTEIDVVGRGEAARTAVPLVAAAAIAAVGGVVGAGFLSVLRP